MFIFPVFIFLHAVWATEMTHTVKQPIRAEQNIFIHDPSK